MKGEKKAYLAFIVFLIVLQLCLGLFISVLATDEEHSYIIFQDDFEDEDAEEWIINITDEVPGSTWSIGFEDDNHFFNQTGLVNAKVGNIVWTDYTFEGKFKWIEPIASNIIFRDQLASGGYYIHLHQNGFSLFKVTENSSALELSSVEQSLSLNTWHSFKIVCVENTFKIYVDNVLKLDYVDVLAPYLSGFVEFELGNYYDEIKVSTTHHLFVTYLISDAEDEINKEKIFGADTFEAEEKLVEAQEALNDGDTSGAEALAKEAIYLAQHAPVGQVSVNDLSDYPEAFNNHTVEVLGTVKDIQHDQGVYNFAVDDGLAAISITFNGTLEEIADEDDVKVVGTFDSFSKSISASTVEKITSIQPTEPTPIEPEPTTPEPTEPTPTEPEPTTTEPTSTEPEPTQPTPSEPSSTEPDSTTPTEPITPESTTPEPTHSETNPITISVEWIAAILSLVGLTAGAGGWLFRNYSARKRHRILFNKLLEDIDDVYSRFKMNTLRCEAELYKYKNQVLEDFKQGLIDEEKFNILDIRINQYLKEIKEKKTEERTQ